VPECEIGAIQAVARVDTSRVRDVEDDAWRTGQCGRIQQPGDGLATAEDPEEVPGDDLRGYVSIWSLSRPWIGLLSCPTNLCRNSSDRRRWPRSGSNIDGTSGRSVKSITVQGPGGLERSDGRPGCGRLGRAHAERVLLAVVAHRMGARWVRLDAWRTSTAYAPTASATVGLRSRRRPTHTATRARCSNPRTTTQRPGSTA
jgi:hypothetical protein